MRRPIFSFPEKLNGGVFGAVVVVSKTQLFRSHIADINPLMAFVLSSVGRVLMKRTPSCSVRSPDHPSDSAAIQLRHDGPDFVEERKEHDGFDVAKEVLQLAGGRRILAGRDLVMFG